MRSNLEVGLFLVPVTDRFLPSVTVCLRFLLVRLFAAAPVCLDTQKRAGGAACTAACFWPPRIVSRATDFDLLQHHQQVTSLIGFFPVGSSLLTLSNGTNFNGVRLFSEHVQNKICSELIWNVLGCNLQSLHSCSTQYIQIYIRSPVTLS